MFDPYHKWLGIPPKDQPPNHYRLLGIDLFETDADVIDIAANKQMAYIQGCATGPHIALSQKLLNEIAAARLTLLNPSRKTAYDTALKARLQPGPETSDVELVVLPASGSTTQSPQLSRNTAAPPARLFQDLTHQIATAEEEEHFRSIKNAANRSRTRWKWIAVLGGIGLLGSLIVLALVSLGKFKSSRSPRRPDELPAKKAVKKNASARHTHHVHPGS
ncbi:MAG: hypothetical protein FJ271_24315 [Planctomycetes bacterium]|nr:hypothetical protein [Planctomycetota bacterium]